jgi:aryl-alcohol dehydrogenase-like predicted oxidoreductase
MLQQRLLGRTGHLSSLVIMGTAAFWQISQEDANAALDLALSHGVNHIDVAPQYGQAQERLGPWLEPRRDKFFLGCKTLERTRDAAWTDLRRSLDLLRTTQLDLYQLHSVGTFDELEKCFAPGGSVEVLAEAKQQGLTRFLGITGHGIQTPAVFLEALRRFDFDTLMFPINPPLYANAEYRRQTEALLALAAERGVAVQIIKAVARGPWGEQTKNYHTWYQPQDEAATIQAWVRFALSQPQVTAIASPGDTRLLPVVLRAAEQFSPLPADEQTALIAAGSVLEPLFV